MNISKLCIVGALALTISCKNETATDQSRTNKSSDELLLNIATDTAKLTNETDEFTVVGEVSFDEDNVVRVFPIVSGSVEKVYVSLGDYVKKGQLMATYLSTDISSYQRDYNVAKSNFELSKKNLGRARELYNTNVISQKELEDADRDFNNAKSEYNEKKQILELYGGSTETLDAVFKVTAPISGYVVERNLNEGMQIRTDYGTHIFTISDLKSVWIWASVYESDLSKVAVGDAVEVRTIAYPDRLFYGKIKTVGTMLDPLSRVVKVRIDLDNSDFLLKPEMFATIVIKPAAQTQSIAIPNNALVFENNQQWVVVKTSGNTFSKRQVTAGRSNSKYTFIHEGLNAGEIVVSNGSLFMNAQINNK